VTWRLVDVDEPQISCRSVVWTAPGVQALSGKRPSTWQPVAFVGAGGVQATRSPASARTGRFGRIFNSDHPFS
jgi:hypothetical protein